MSSCKHDATLGYRIRPGRHDDTCASDLCRGCQPCPDRHCVVCYRGHCDDTHPQTCPECVGIVRENLEAIVDLEERRCISLHLGHAPGDGRLNAGPLGGDAMVMGADGRYLSASKRGPDELVSDPPLPLLTLATWEDDWRIELGHGGGPRATVWRAVDYLGQHLTMMAQRHLAFDEFVADVAKVRGRLEAVLGDGDRPETGAPCMKCGSALVKRYGRTAAFDLWRCPRGACGETYSPDQYLFAVQNEYRKHAPAMTADDIADEYDVQVGTIRVWANRGKVAKRGRDTNGRQLYDVADVIATRDGSAA